MISVNQSKREISWRGAIRWVATILVVTPIGIIISSNVQKLAQDRQWDTFLSNWWPTMLELSPLLEHSWFWFVFGVLAATSVLLWADKLLRVRVRQSQKDKSPAQEVPNKNLGPVPIVMEFNPESEKYFNQEDIPNPDISSVVERYRKYHCMMFNDSDETLVNVSCEVERIITTQNRPNDVEIAPENVHDKLRYDVPPTFPARMNFSPSGREKLWLFSRLTKALDSEPIRIVKGDKFFYDKKRLRQVFLRVTADNHVPKIFSVTCWVQDGNLRMTGIRPEG